MYENRSYLFNGNYFRILMFFSRFQHRQTIYTKKNKKEKFLQNSFYLINSYIMRSFKIEEKKNFIILLWKNN
jgi:hypothetical protein